MWQVLKFRSSSDFKSFRFRARGVDVMKQLRRRSEWGSSRSSSSSSSNSSSSSSSIALEFPYMFFVAICVSTLL